MIAQPVAWSATAQSLLSMKASDGIRPVPGASSASPGAGSGVRQTGVWLTSVSATQVSLPVQPDGTWPAWQTPVAASAQRMPPAALASATQTWLPVHELLHGGAGRSAFSTSTGAPQSSLESG